MIQSIVHFVSFLKSIERKILLQKWLPYSDRFGVKKTFLVTLYKHSSSKIHTSLRTSFYLSLGGAFKKNLPSKWKNPSKPRFSGPFYILSHFPSFSLLPPNSISSGNENKHLVSWLPRNPGFLLLFYTWTPRGFGLVPKRNLWFPGCWENLYLKVNLFLFFSVHGSILACLL